MFDPDSPEEKAEAKRLAEQMAVRAIGGCCAGPALLAEPHL